MSTFCWDTLLLLLCCIVLVGFSAGFVGDVGGDYLDSQQAEVVELSNQASDNYKLRCESLANCDNPSNCSHSVCEPLVGDLEGLTCTTVVNSTYCSLPGNGITPCTSTYLDYRKSCVRVAESTDRESVDTMLSICFQRELDPLMKSFTSTNPSAFTRSYFATNDGSWRVLPGSARSAEDYDPRFRPWFSTSTWVAKVVAVIVDLAASMNSFGAGSMLQVAQNITSQLLTTLSADDLVNVIVFNSTGAYQLNPEEILVQEYNSSGQPQLQQSNLTAAIRTALPNFESHPFAAKVILVLTDGVLDTLGNVTLPAASL